MTVFGGGGHGSILRALDDEKDFGGNFDFSRKESKESDTTIASSILSSWNLDDAHVSSPWESIGTMKAGGMRGSLVGKRKGKNPFRRSIGEVQLRHMGSHGSEMDGWSYASSEVSSEGGSKLKKPRPPKGAWIFYSYDARNDVSELPL